MREGRNTVYKPSATYPQGKGGVREPPLTRFPCVSLSLYDCRLSTRLLFHLLLLSLACAHNLFLQSHYLSVSPYDRIFNYATVLPHSISSLLLPWFIVAERCGAGALRKAEEAHN